MYKHHFRCLLSLSTAWITNAFVMCKYHTEYDKTIHGLIIWVNGKLVIWINCELWVSSQFCQRPMQASFTHDFLFPPVLPEWFYCMHFLQVCLTWDVLQKHALYYDLVSTVSTIILSQVFVCITLLQYITSQIDLQHVQKCIQYLEPFHWSTCMGVNLCILFPRYMYLILCDNLH